MYPIPESVTPAVRTHLDAHLAFFSDLSNSLASSFQRLCEANIQLGQAMLADTIASSQQLLTATSANDALSMAASRTTPASSTLQAYQEQISRLAAEAQAELTRVSTEHVQNTTRTAQSLAQEVTRVVADQTERSARKQKDILKNFSTPSDNAGGQRGSDAMEAHGTMQSADNGSGMQSEGGNADAGASSASPQGGQSNQQS